MSASRPSCSVSAAPGMIALFHSGIVTEATPASCLVCTSLRHRLRTAELPLQCGDEAVRILHRIRVDHSGLAIDEVCSEVRRKRRVVLVAVFLEQRENLLPEATAEFLGVRYRCPTFEKERVADLL